VLEGLEDLAQVFAHVLGALQHELLGVAAGKAEARARPLLVAEAEENLARVRLHHLARDLGLRRARAHPDAVAGSPRSRIQSDHLALDEEGVAAARARLDGSLREAGNALLQAG